MTDQKVGDFVSQNIKTAHVFKKYGIDFCCGGGISLEEACRKKNLIPKNVLEELLQVKDGPEIGEDFANWSPDKLIDHILTVHHTYVLESLPKLISYSQKVAGVHGHHFGELHAIKDLIQNLSEELLSHMKKEEVVLFPYILNLLEMQAKGLQPKQPFVGSPIGMMKSEHEDAGNLLKDLRELSKDFTAPESACNTYRALYDLLEEFESDLFQHIHLENNLLFPKALELESDLILRPSISEE